MGGSRWRFGHEGTFHGIEIGGACGPVAGSGNGNLGAVHPIQYNSGHNADGTINAWNSADGARQGSAGAEHGAGFYRRKDQLRRRLLEAIAGGEVADPIRWLTVARHGLASCELPTIDALAAAFSPEPLAA